MRNRLATVTLTALALALIPSNVAHPDTLPIGPAPASSPGNFRDDVLLDTSQVEWR